MATPGDHVAAERELIVDVRDGEAQFGDAVSVIMPVLNEERHLEEAVGAVLDQDFPGLIEVILALGPSTDNTDSVAADLVAGDSRVHTVPNPSGRTPTALNAALQVATHSIIVRVDGHCELPRDYISRAVETLIRTGADNVGGVMAAEGTTDFESAVALAMTSKLGVGGAPFHVGGQEGEAQTVYLGVFRAQTLQRVGGYDESFDRAQDWEMNHRIRSLGGKIWFNPQMQVSYRPRPDLKALARQYFQYGTWRREVMRRHPETVQARYLAPPVAVAAIGVGVAAGITGLVVPSAATLRLGWLIPGGYAAAVALGGIAISRGESRSVRARVPAVLAAMHLSWGVGFLTSRPQTGGKS